MRVNLLVAAVLWLPSLTFAAHDFNGTDGKGVGSAAEVTDYPFSISCWVNSDSATAAQNAAYVGNGAGTARAQLSLDGNVAGDKFGAYSVSSGGASAGAVTSTGYTAGTWHHFTAVYASATSRAAYIDGGSKGTNATSVATSSYDTTILGVRRASGTDAGYLDGRLAECGMWSVELTDDEATVLSKGFAPPCVRRASLLAYYPMVRDSTSLKDLFSATANNLTLAGTTAPSDHPRIINCQ